MAAGIVYCTFDFYQNDYHGTIVTNDGDFRRHLIHATAMVDQMTFGRLKMEAFASVEDVPVEVKYAVCAAVERHAQAEQHDGHTVASETTSKHSVTYADAASSVKAEMYRSAMQFLSGTKWVYRGLYPNERDGTQLD